MNLPVKNRIVSLDFLKGLVMVIMALDHTRDYFHWSAFFYDPTDPLRTTFPIYFTRWITHYCAPVFSFLAGMSAFLVGLRKSKRELSTFLLKRGLWLVLIELTVVNFGWFFDIRFHNFGLLVIWALGISMIVLALLIHLKIHYILFFSLILIFGHNLLDDIHFKENLLWSVIHQSHLFFLPDKRMFFVGYPIIPWIAVMSLGYCFGNLYQPGYDALKRKSILRATGIAATLLFLIIRAINIYGDPEPWKQFTTLEMTLMSFFNPAKYPPSLSYVLMTLGPALIFLSYVENVRGKVMNFFSLYGRVPFFYYILHIYFIHLAALLTAEITGYGWETMILYDWVSFIPELKGFGFRLWAVYLIWIAIVLMLFPLCKWFDHYKKRNPQKWWLSYL